MIDKRLEAKKCTADNCITALIHWCEFDLVVLEWKKGCKNGHISCREYSGSVYMWFASYHKSTRSVGIAASFATFSEAHEWLRKQHGVK